MSRRAMLSAAAVLGVTSVTVVSGIAGGSPDSGRGHRGEAHGDRIAKTANPSAMTPQEAREREGAAAAAVRRGGVDARDLLSLLRRPADEMPGWVAPMPQTRLEGGAAKRLRVARGVPKTWILTDRSGILVALAYDYSTAWFLSRDILSGHVLMVDENDTSVAVTGVLPDGTREASISTDDGARTLRMVNGVYSERFARTAVALPRVLTFTDARGTHTVRIPLSRDVAG